MNRVVAKVTVSKAFRPKEAARPLYSTCPLSLPSWRLHAETPSPNQANAIHPMTTRSMGQQVKRHPQFLCKGFSGICLHGIDHLRGQLNIFKMISPYCKKMSCRHIYIKSFFYFPTTHKNFWATPILLTQYITKNISESIRLC